jgi:ornithine carbamoyltransferase
VAAKNGGKIEISSDENCLMCADVIYTDVWASMGEEDQIPEKARMMAPFKVTAETMARTGNPDALFMHCLPAFHDFETKLAKNMKELGYDIREVTDEVFRSRNSVVFDQAENRMHTIKAVLVATIGR